MLGPIRSSGVVPGQEVRVAHVEREVRAQEAQVVGSAREPQVRRALEQEPVAVVVVRVHLVVRIADLGRETVAVERAEAPLHGGPGLQEAVGAELGELVEVEAVAVVRDHPGVELVAPPAAQVVVGLPLEGPAVVAEGRRRVAFLDLVVAEDRAGPESAVRLLPEHVLELDLGLDAVLGQPVRCDRHVQLLVGGPEERKTHVETVARRLAEGREEEPRLPLLLERVAHPGQPHHRHAQHLERRVADGGVAAELEVRLPRGDLPGKAPVVGALAGGEARVLEFVALGADLAHLRALHVEVVLRGPEPTAEHEPGQLADLEVEDVGVQHVAALLHHDVAGGDAEAGGVAERGPVGGEDAPLLGDAHVAAGDVHVPLALVLHRVRGQVEGALGRQGLGPGRLRVRRPDEDDGQEHGSERLQRGPPRASGARRRPR